jgi:hypothetical protein
MAVVIDQLPGLLESLKLGRGNAVIFNVSEEVSRCSTVDAVPRMEYGREDLMISGQEETFLGTIAPTFIQLYSNFLTTCHPLEGHTCTHRDLLRIAKQFEFEFEIMRCRDDVSDGGGSRFSRRDASLRSA